MFGFFKSKTQMLAATVARPASSPAPSPNSAQPDIQRDLVQLALRETLKQHGVPRGLIRGELLRVTDKDGRQASLICLVIMKWSQNLLRCGYAFERQLLKKLAEYEPGSTQSRFSVAWRYDENCQCPCVEMPSGSFWQSDEEARQTPQKTDLFDRRGSVRPASAPIFVREDDQPVEREDLFAPTSLSPLS